MPFFEVPAIGDIFKISRSAPSRDGLVVPLQTKPLPPRQKWRLPLEDSEGSNPALSATQSRLIMILPLRNQISARARLHAIPRLPENWRSARLMPFLPRFSPRGK